MVGATVEERGWDTTPTAGGAYELLRDALTLVPGLDEAELVAARAGLRPGTPDDLPMIGATGVDGLVVATGHHRNGILLTPDHRRRRRRTWSPATPVPGRGGGVRPPPVRAGRVPRRPDDGRRHRPAVGQRRGPVAVDAGHDGGRPRRRRSASSPAGIAVAVNGEVVPRRTWADRPLAAGEQVEVLSIAQGG